MSIIDFLKKCCCYIKKNITTKENYELLISFIEKYKIIPKKKDNLLLNNTYKILNKQSNPSDIIKFN